MLRSAIDRAADRFATACGPHSSKRELRDRADDLVLELLGALRGASLAEIAQAVTALTKRQKTRPAAPPPSQHRSAPRAKSKAAPRRDVEPRAAARPRVAQVTAARTPFDITMPSELLAPASPSRELASQISVSAAAPERSVAEAAKATNHARTERLIGAEAAPESSRSARVTLREGEELVRNGGSGAIIRRTRSA